MYHYSQLIEKTEAAIAGIQYPQQPEGLYEPMAYVLSLGGKRIRPVFLLLAAQLFDKHAERHMDAAVSLEMFHNYTLLHDDLMDKADVRRGQPTVHRRWDANTAILSGDAMLMLASKRMYEATTECPVAMQEYLKTALEVSEGQQYDMNFEHRTDVTLDEYFEMIRLKTGVLISCALRMGALLGGASQKDADILYAYGEQIGKAFQVQDDYLDVFGDVKTFGKKIGGDILEGKKTFLLINAFNKASATQKMQMMEWLDCHDAEPQDKIDFFTRLYEELDIPGDYNRCMKECFDKADALLDSLDVPEDVKAALKEFADTLSRRNR